MSKNNLTLSGSNLQNIQQEDNTGERTKIDLGKQDIMHISRGGFSENANNSLQEPNLFVREALPEVEDISLLNDSGKDFFEYKKYEEAEEYFLNAIKLSKNRTPEEKTEYYINLAATQFELGKYEYTYTSLTNSLKICPKNYHDTINKIIDLFDKCAQKIKEINKEIDNESGYLNNFGMVLYERQQKRYFSKVEDYFVDAIELSKEKNPEKEAFYYNLANVQFYQNEYQDAYENILISLELCNGNDRKCLEKIKNLFDLINQKVEEPCEYWKICHDYGVQLLGEEKYKEAKELFLKAVELVIDQDQQIQSDYYLNLAVAQYHLEECEEASESCNKGLELIETLAGPENNTRKILSKLSEDINNLAKPKPSASAAKADNFIEKERTHG